jgi:hypothetical protein
MWLIVILHIVYITILNIVIDILLKLQSETYLFMNSPHINKLRIAHEEIIVQWKK